jgi:hypothetical protein
MADGFRIVATLKEIIRTLNANFGGGTSGQVLAKDSNSDHDYSWQSLSSSELSDLTDVNTSTPTNRNVLVADGVDWESRALVEADISDLQSYLTSVSEANVESALSSATAFTANNYVFNVDQTIGVGQDNYVLTYDNVSGEIGLEAVPPAGAEVNDLSAAVTWANVPDANITEGSVTQHQAALTIIEGQITGAAFSNWNTAFGWGDHAGSYLPLSGGTLTGNVIQDPASGSISNQFDVPTSSDDVDAQYRIAGTLTALIRWDSSVNQFRWMDRDPSPVTAMTLNLEDQSLTVVGAVTGSNLNVSNWDTAYGWGDHAGLYEVVDAAIVRSDEAETITAGWTFSGAQQTFSHSGSHIKLVDTDDADASFNLIERNGSAFNIYYWDTVPGWTLGLKIADEGALTLYHNGSAKLATASDGIDVTGDVGGTTIGGITEANLLDKTADETITGIYTIQDTLAAGINYSLVVNGDDTGTDGEAAGIFIGGINNTVRGAYIGAERLNSSNQHAFVIGTSAVSAEPAERVRITDTAFTASNLDADFDAITATSYGGITEANLLDKTASETVSGSWVFTSGLTRLQHSAPQLIWDENSGPTNETIYRLLSDAGGFQLRAYDDAETSFDRVFSVQRTAANVDGMIFYTDNDTNRMHIGTTGITVTGEVSATTLELTGATLDSGSASVTTDNDTADEVGFKGSPFNEQNGNYTLLLTDCGKTIHKASGGVGETITIPANSGTAFPVGTIIAITNEGGDDLTIAITTDTLTDQDGITGSRTLADNKTAIIRKTATTTWYYYEPPVDGVSEINEQNGNYELVISDKGRTIYKSSGAAGETITIPANASKAFPVGSMVCIQNHGGGDLSVAITTDTLKATDGTTGTQTLADDNVAMIQKVASTTWIYAASDT